MTVSSISMHLVDTELNDSEIRNAKRRNAILALAGSYQYDEAHSHQVECLAGSLFLALEPLHHLATNDRRLLEYAAILHDIGYFLCAKGHHRHVLQLVMTEPLPEFSRGEKGVVANVARYHRKAMPSPMHTLFAVLSDEDQHRVLLLAPILRLADALDRSHQGAVEELRVEIEDAAVHLHIGAVVDMTLECDAVDRKCDMFRQVYSRDVVLHVQSAGATSI